MSQHPIHAAAEAAYNAQDLQAFAELYAPDAVMMAPSGEQILQGREAIQAALQGLFALQGTVRMETVYCLERGDIALLRGHIRLQFVDENGQAQETTQNTTEILVRETDGAWRFVIDHPGGAEAG